MVISPIILARLLSVTEFGHYREFLVYVTVLVGMAAFGINSSLLNFIPTEPTRGWRFVNQAVLMTLTSSTLVVTDRSDPPAAPLLPPLAAGVLDEDVPHGPGGRREEVPAVGEPGPGVAGQPQVRLVHQGGRLERAPRRYTGQPARGQPAAARRRPAGEAGPPSAEGPGSGLPGFG